MDLEPLEHDHHAQSWAPSLVRRLMRNPRTYWLAVASLVAITVLTVNHLTTSAERLRAAYDETAEVAVLTAELQAGEHIGNSIELRTIPRALIPDDAVRTVGDAATTSGPISRGAILTSQDITAPSALASNRAAIAVPVGASTPPLAPGQRVLIVIHGDVFAGIDGGLVEAVVHAAGPEQLLVAVARSDLLSLSSALAGNGVTVALI